MLDDASRTAEMNALIRASDQRWDPSQRILDDPYAQRFLGKLTQRALRSWRAGGRVSRSLAKVAPAIRNYVLARHRYIDDALGSALARDDVQQVVLLGAGYDSRPWRFASALAGRPVFEVDHPATTARKTRLLSQSASNLPAANRRVVSVDFEVERFAEKLIDAGFVPGISTFFIWEGVAMYLTRQAVKDSLSAMAELAGPGSTLCMDCWFLLDRPDTRATVHRMSANLLHVLGEPAVFGIHPEDIGHFLQKQGWSVEDVGDETTLYDRYIPARDRPMYPAQYVLRAARIQDTSPSLSVVGGPRR